MHQLCLKNELWEPLFKQAHEQRGHYAEVAKQVTGKKGFGEVNLKCITVVLEHVRTSTLSSLHLLFLSSPISFSFLLSPLSSLLSPLSSLLSLSSLLYPSPLSSIPLSFLLSSIFSPLSSTLTLPQLSPSKPATVKVSDFINPKDYGYHEMKFAILGDGGVGFVFFQKREEK
jgi:hypothetical protein